MDDRLYWIWMQRATQPGSLKTDALLRGLGTARAVYEASPGDLGLYGLSKNELNRLGDKCLDTANEVLGLALKNDCWVLTPADGLYPSLLRSIPGIPLVLYGYGELPDLDMIPGVAIVGTRATTNYGRRATALLAGGIALGGAVVISGGALGADAAAHEAALAAGGQTVAVQGCGLDIDYPQQNRELRRKIARFGAIITEFPPGTPPLKFNFPLRNRIISGMSLGVCVTEAPAKSGALITARHAFEQGRDVFAVAGDMLTGRSAGTDELIRQGARLITGADEILEEYLSRFPDILNPKVAETVRHDPRFQIQKHTDGVSDKKINRNDHAGMFKEQETRRQKPQCPEHISHDAGALWQLISDVPKPLGELIDASGMAAQQVMTALTELELIGAICCGPGQVYMLL